MFSYKLPEDGLKSISFFNEQGQIKFDPPVYQQRYSTVLQIIEDPRWKQHFKKIVDFGCGEMKMLPLLRRIPEIEHLIEVDTDEEVLKAHQYHAKPLISDYIKKCETPLRVEIFQGSIDASVEQVQNGVDVVIGIEVIEHLYSNTLENVPQNIFGFIQPKLAIFTTPNSEFNVLFSPLLPNGFRHLDHKFEWNRQEFKEWTMSICSRFPNYQVAILGVGNPPPDHKKIGYVTQIAIFARNDMLCKPLSHPINRNIPVDTNPDAQYKEILSVDFPFFPDERSMETKILDHANYSIQRSRFVEKYFNRERYIYQIPIDILMEYTASLGSTIEELRTILRNNKYEVENDFIVLPEYDEHGSDDNHDDDWDENYGACSDVVPNRSDNDSPEECWD